MKKTTLIMVAVGVAIMVGCNQGKNSGNGGANFVSSDSLVVNDTTVYGVCGENSAMHTLELKGDDGRLYHFMINPDDSISPVKGGMLAGDRMAVIAEVLYGDTMAAKVLNLTTLLGRWVSLDRNFEIKEGGVIESHLEAETHPWTTWKICNGQLVLNRDTFDVAALGADSLLLENETGIFGYKRVKK